MHVSIRISPLQCSPIWSSYITCTKLTCTMLTWWTQWWKHVIAVVCWFHAVILLGHLLVGNSQRQRCHAVCRRFRLACFTQRFLVSSKTSFNTASDSSRPHTSDTLSKFTLTINYQVLNHFLDIVCTAPSDVKLDIKWYFVRIIIKQIFLK